MVTSMGLGLHAPATTDPMLEYLSIASATFASSSSAGGSVSTSEASPVDFTLAAVSAHRACSSSTSSASRASSESAASTDMYPFDGDKSSVPNESNATSTPAVGTFSWSPQGVPSGVSGSLASSGDTARRKLSNMFSMPSTMDLIPIFDTCSNPFPSGSPPSGLLRSRLMITVPSAAGSSSCLGASSSAAAAAARLAFSVAAASWSSPFWSARACSMSSCASSSSIWARSAGVCSCFTFAVALACRSSASSPTNLNMTSPSALRMTSTAVSVPFSST
mmetsp:Transcript_12432/g.57562  ORF Transcript_12432/g.57562 Transcript_12432/m.57562 type:complete len:277 (+) Transcript_12432:2734-3564(+)